MKYLSNIHTNYEAESTRKTDTTRFSIYRMSQMLFEVGKLIFGEKEKEKRSSKTHILLLILSIRKTKLVF